MMHRFAIGFLLFSIGGSAMAETFVSIAPIAAEKNDSNTAPPVEVVQDLVLSCLSKDDALAVVERTALDTLTIEESKSMTGFGQGKPAAMHLKRVEYVITGSVAALKGKWLISLQANDPATTQVIAAASAELSLDFYRNADAFCTAAVSPLTDKLLRHRSKPLGAGAMEDAQSEESTLLLKGIGYANNGDYARAFPFFLKILDHNPHNADAHYVLAISYAKAGLTSFAQKEAAECFAEFPAHPKRRELELLLAPTGLKEKHL